MMKLKTIPVLVILMRIQLTVLPFGTIRLMRAERVLTALLRDKK